MTNAVNYSYTAAQADITFNRGDKLNVFGIIKGTTTVALAKNNGCKL